jgi:PAS domain S-box-containing protein
MKFTELVDTGELRALCESFTALTGAVTAILDLEGNVLIATGWQDICTRFHRVHLSTATRCRESDTVLASQLQRGERYNIYKCRNGLVDVAMPIVIGGEHVANFFTGQFFTEAPDKEYFVRQAEEFGFNKGAYLDALKRVPVFSEDKIKSMMEFFTRLAQLIGEMGLSKKRMEEAISQLNHQQEHLEELVRERTADLNRAQEIARVGSWRWNVRTGEVSWSDELYRVFGLSPGEPAHVTFDTFLSRVHEDEREAVAARFNGAMAARRPFGFEFRTVPIDGAERIVRAFGEIRCDEDGEPTELFGADQDITEERRAQQLLAKAKELAEAASRAKSTFLANMSHELRTPLNAILGYAQILKRDKGLKDRQLDGLSTIQRSGEHLLTLINDVLDLSKIEAGKFELCPGAVNLPGFLQVVADIIRVKAEQHSLLFFYEASPDLPMAVRADEKRLRQVLLNLLVNAVKFTKRGQVRLRVQCQLGDNDQVRLRFEIQDTGVGISPAQLETIFQPFEQAGDVQSRRGGTGLGLAISRQLVHSMGGEIHVESALGKGSRFWFDVDVPLEAEVATRPAERVATGYQGPRRKVLIVDDVVANRAMLVDLLSTLGFEVQEAANGQEGLEQAQESWPDLILTDIMMPVMDGLEATRRIRRLPHGRGVPILAVSASASLEDQARSLAGGASAFLTKPIDQGRLLHEIGAHLGLSWTYEPPQGRPAAEEADARPLVPPPQAQLAQLYPLAQAGNMRDILHWATQLTNLGEQYGPFATRICELARGYQSKAILGLVERHMNATRRPSSLQASPQASPEP